MGPVIGRGANNGQGCLKRQSPPMGAMSLRPASACGALREAAKRGNGMAAPFPPSLPPQGSRSACRVQNAEPWVALLALSRGWKGTEALSRRRNLPPPPPQSPPASLFCSRGAAADFSKSPLP